MTGLGRGAAPPRDRGDLEIDDLLARQCGVISRRQVLAAVGSDSSIARRLRRRAWASIHPGVYVDHTGPLTWPQRAWAAVLYAAPAALGGRSALRAHGVRGHDTDEIHVVVAQRRKVRPRSGLRVERLNDFDRAVQANLSPPRVRVEHVAPRLRRRRLLLAIVEDAARGAYSALERRYLLHVECAHGLPAARRQYSEATSAGAAQRDVEYADRAMLVELDGRLGHEWARDR